ncbi:MAG: hypothetical protein OXC05_13140 [Halieaceae bacterium]|nr:hypothetical protein [Halieaceae bacterium]
MSLHAVERLLFTLNRDSDKADRFLNERASFIDAEKYFTDEEKRMFTDGDVLALYRHGVHPLLLVQASRFFGMDGKQFHEVLKPAVGERTA